MRHSTLTRRGGFTLVELLIAAALTMLIMTILAMSFQTAMDSLSHLRSAGDLQDRLRTAGEKLRQDLAAPHFEDESVPHGMVSNVRFDRNANATPSAGYFRIDQGTPSVQEHSGSATSSRDYSTVATTHAMQFTVRLPGTSRQSIFTAPRVGCSTGQQGLDETHDNLIRDTATYGSRWGVVSWFLTPSGETTKGTDVSGTRQPMFTLHRRVRVLAEVPNGHIDGAATNPFFVADAATGLVRTAREVATGNRPVDMYVPLGDGSDIVLANVLSFEVKAEYSDVYTFTTAGNLLATSGTAKYPRPGTSHTLLPSPPLTQDPRNANNQDFPYDDLPPNPLLQGFGTVAQREARAFDTGLAGGTGLINQPGLSGYPQSYRIKSLQVKLRIYDPKTMNTRQVTLVQDL
jgi:Tfp pilus assembly protein FimT